MRPNRPDNYNPKNPRRSSPTRNRRPEKPQVSRQVTSLWDYPSQSYGEDEQGDKHYKGVTPSYVIWNLIQRYTQPKELVIDPFCGSGTTLDVARELGRKSLGYDVHPTRSDIFRVDARKLPPELSGKASLVFMDPPYSTHIDYGNDPRDIGKLDAKEEDYFHAMCDVFNESYRVLKPDGVIAVFVGDSYVHPDKFHAIGAGLLGLLGLRFNIIDHLAVKRHNRTLEMGNYRKAADEGNFYLRGYHHLLLARKTKDGSTPTPPSWLRVLQQHTTTTTKTRSTTNKSQPPRRPDKHSTRPSKPQRPTKRTPRRNPER